MTRFQFGSYGEPIPNIAMPDPNLSGDLPIQSLELVDGVPFLKADWVALGYTHYEVWCIGAAGGKGASPNQPHFYTTGYLEAGSGINWHMDSAPAVMPPDIWELVLREADWYALHSGSGSATDNYLMVVPVGTPLPSYGVINSWQWLNELHVLVTPRARQELLNPTHMSQINTYHDPYLVEWGSYQGGGGGGGGLHVIRGELATLPDSVPISVGRVGADAPPGQINVEGVYTPPFPSENTYWPLPPGWGSPQDIQYYTDKNTLYAWQNDHSGPVVSFNPPGPGGDGGASAFGDICFASGGKGGGPSFVWANGLRAFKGFGGDGGSGGRLLAGGGGVGATELKPAGDGTWDGTIGKGGGGGRGGIEERKVSTPEPLYSL